MKKKCLVVLVFSILFWKVSAVDFSLRVNPQATIPLQDYYKLAFGVNVQTDVQLFNFLTTGVEGGFMMETPEGYSSPITFMNGGIGVGGFYNLFSRFYVAGGGAFGLYTYSYQGTDDTNKASDMYWRGYGEFGFRFNPTLTLSLNGGYTSYMVKQSTPVVSGPFFGVSLRVNFSTSKSAKNACYATVKQDADILPLFMQLYKNDPVASVIVTNGESAEIKNVTVSFTAGKYTSSALRSESIPVLRKMQSATIPLTVDFSSELLSFAESGMVSGNLVIEYELLGKKKTAIQSISLSVSNRNSYTWGDYESLAAYISPDTPEVLEYAKYVAGIARNDLYSGMNRNVQFAAVMFDALKESGLVYSGDKTTPYATYHLGYDEDYIQYPLQTMDFSSGDLDELGILYASCLESVGIGTAFIPMEDNFLVLVNTGLSPSSALSHFTDENSLVITDETVYFAVSMADLASGFAKSRAQAAKLITKINTSDDAFYEFIETEYAWNNYPPAIYTGSGETLPKPSQDKVKSLFKAAVDDYINTDLAAVIKRARDSGDSNKLGMAYVRAGQYTNAKNEFSKTAAKGSVSGMNNLGNVYLIEKNYTAAEKQFKQVLAVEPNNKTALKGLENMSSSLGD